jgi:hypothetical protein
VLRKATSVETATSSREERVDDGARGYLRRMWILERRMYVKGRFGGRCWGRPGFLFSRPGWRRGGACGS